MTKDKKADKEAPKIIVDDDWKAEAQAEKKRLAEEVEKAKAAKPAAGAQASGAADEHAASREIPPASFTTLVNSLAMQTILSLGGYEDPKTKKRYVDLDLARHHIDTLAVLQEKTEGRLTDDENALLDQTLYELRLSYVQVSHRVRRDPAGAAEEKSDDAKAKK